MANHPRNTGPMRSSRRCGAKTRSGKPCMSPAVSGKKRCRMHGGAPGSGAPIGQQERAEEWAVHARGDRRAARAARPDPFGTAARAEDRVTVATGKPALATRVRRPSRSVHRGLIWEAGFRRRAGSRVRAPSPNARHPRQPHVKVLARRLLRRCSIQSSLSHLSRFFRRTPGPPPFSSMNFIPADSRAF